MQCHINNIPKTLSTRGVAKALTLEAGNAFKKSSLLVFFHLKITPPPSQQQFLPGCQRLGKMVSRGGGGGGWLRPCYLSVPFYFSLLLVPNVSSTSLNNVRFD